MKFIKSLLTILLVLFLASSSYAADADEWRDGDGSETPTGTDLINDLDTIIDGNIVQPLDRLLANYREDAKLVYNSATTIDIQAGEVTCSNSGASIRMMRQNTSSTSLTFSDLDTGAEASSTTYYVYAVCDADATTFTGKISASSSSPTGITYFQRLGSFFNDSSSDIVNDNRIVNDNDFYALKLGDNVLKSQNTNYQAATDLFITAFVTFGSDPTQVEGLTDSTTPPTTTVIKDETNNKSSAEAGIAFSVKKGDYWKVAVSGATATVYSRPLE